MNIHRGGNRSYRKNSDFMSGPDVDKCPEGVKMTFFNLILRGQAYL